MIQVNVKKLTKAKTADVINLLKADHLAETAILAQTAEHVNLLLLYSTLLPLFFCQLTVWEVRRSRGLHQSL